MDLSNFETNKEKEVSGVWHQLGEDTKVLVARAGNTKYIAELQKRMKPHQNRLRMNDESLEAVAESILTDLMAEYILLDWKGLTENGKKITYSIEECRRVLADKKYTDFRNIISNLSDDMVSYQNAKKEKILGNSKTS